ncbi:MAG: hypothetical protein K8R91_06170, partial [Phycisphaerae bacterium]|nr:hypothetical protein [Phycisphaerae bacterium]
EMGGGPVGQYCDKCKSENAVFMMNRCLKCKEYYLSKRITDPEAFARDGNKDICPLCGTNQYEWYKKHPRRR